MPDLVLDILPVGTGKSGDALLIQIGLGHNRQIIVVDGGTKDSGSNLASCVADYCGKNTIIDHVICTHPHNDHSGGLTELLSHFRVLNFWMHRPWLHAAELNPLLLRQRKSHERLVKHLYDQYEDIFELDKLARWHNPACRLLEPFQGCRIGPLVCLSPSKEFYNSLLPHFDDTPPARTYSTAGGSFFGGLVLENLDNESLSNSPPPTTPENESSVVLYLPDPSDALLLTADAGPQAIQLAINYARSLGVDLLRSVGIFQLPHHGSRRNITPNLLDQILGRAGDLSRVGQKYVFVTAGSSDPDHPRPAVVNAAIRRGAKVYTTRGSHLLFERGSVVRRNWSRATPLEFNDIV